MADARQFATLRGSMPLPDLLPIQPFTRPARGEVALPGSKSITNRALLLAALCDEPVTLTGALFSEDTHLMGEALRQLGFEVSEDANAKTILVHGRGGEIPAGRAELFVGLAGTTARFLTALCATAPRGAYRLDGVPQMRKRPMKPLLEALRALGAEIRCTAGEGFFPLEVHARGLAGGSVELDASESSQLLSALLMVAPLARGDVHVTLRGSVRRAYVDMTAQVMRAFTPDRGSLIQVGDAQSFTVTARARPYRLPDPGGRYAIEPDASAASYFLALPLVTGGQLTLLGAQDSKRGLQGDTEFAEVVRAIGARVHAEPHGLDVSFGGSPGVPPACSSNAGGTPALPAIPSRAGLDRNFKGISDTFLTLAAIAPLLSGPTRISGIAHTRKQETDRVAGMARELARIGQRVIETDDSLEIHPQPLRAGETIETYGDHRFAMSFGVLGCHDLHGDGRPWLSIKNPACCAKTFPDFFGLLESLRQKSLAG